MCEREGGGESLGSPGVRARAPDSLARRLGPAPGDPAQEGRPAAIPVETGTPK